MGIAEQKSQVAEIAVCKEGVKIHSYQPNYIATLPNYQEKYEQNKIFTAL